MPTSSVIAGVYDFSLSYTTCKRLEYLDNSEWMVGGQYAVPTIYTIRITSPEGRFKDLQVFAQAPNILTPEQLGYSGCLPGGIYKFQALDGHGVGGHGYIKKVGIFCDEECGLQKAISKLQPGEDDSHIQKIKDSLYYARNAAELGDTSQVIDWLKIIKSELRRLNCACKCS